MKNITRYNISTVICLMFIFNFTVKADVNNDKAIVGLVKRILPGNENSFILETIDKHEGRDVFEIDSHGGKVVLRGNNGVSIASALNWYLKYYCNCCISWGGDNLELPEILPLPADKFRKISPHKYRYYLNDCTFAYSTVWWDWSRWEREIDWMAMNGINLPMVVTGWEAVWQETLKPFGFTNEQVRKFCGGPAWSGWMGAHEGYGGPVSQKWVDEHLKIAQKIIARQKELGMTPATRAFYGYVPAAMKDKHPDAKYLQAGGWSGFPGSTILDPLDPLFEKVCKRYMQQQKLLLGETHFYAADPVHEGGAAYTRNKEYIEKASRKISAIMAEEDPLAQWIMTSWKMSANVAKALPAERILALDLFAEHHPKWKKHQFWQRPWLWCLLHNFGGNTDMGGNLKAVAKGPLEALNSPNNGNMTGIGIAPEGIETNPVVYDLMAEMAWTDQTLDIEQWVKSYSHRRCGNAIPQAEAAWKILLDTVYSQPTAQGPRNSVICARPGLGNIRARTWGHTSISYDPAELFKAWQLLQSCSSQAGDIDTYQYDLVCVGLQSMADLGKTYHRQIVSAYKAADSKALDKAGNNMLELISDMDALAGTRRELLLGDWIKSAKERAADQRERKLLEWNARNQITLWISHGPDSLNDYGNKHWSGLFRGFYLVRWQRFIDELDKSLKDNKPFDGKGFRKRIAKWEEQWTKSTDPYPTAPSGKSVSVSKQLLSKYLEKTEGLKFIK